MRGERALDGMILAAGLGTRLRPLTDDLPKALVRVDGVAQLDRTLARLSRAGCDRIVVNVHHHADLIERHLAEARPDRPGPTESAVPSHARERAVVLVSREEARPLDTGGGIRHARGLFRGDRTILVHNVDVISDVDLDSLVREHESSGALATLAVQRREASRYLVFDASGLCGRIDAGSGHEEWARKPAGSVWKAGFTGIHALGPDLPGLLTERGVFPIIASYLRLAAAGVRILPFDVTGVAWHDIGTHERLAGARRRFEAGDEA